ncbi:polyprenyl synthetase family protein [Streptomyces sp. NPDC014870]|uniref:polyprenyl synthetase family protein n=1 Tax=Streptomyces sp. NPDC014870 TaxID=3364925 RepID=UPI003702DE1F
MSLLPLGAVHDLVSPRLREALSGLPASVRELAFLHFDSCSRPDAPLDVGKLYRAALTLAWNRALGGDQGQALHAAVAVELVHNASLLHDDVIDGDRLRRGRQTVWALRGPAAGILAGNALFFLAVQQLNTAGDPLSTSGVAELASAVQHMIDGEWADTRVPQDADAYLSACEGKTGALIGAACALGALTAGATEHRIGQVRAFGLHVGAAFQVTDDLLNLWGDPEQTGKPHRGDLANGRNSYPVLAALGAGSDASASLRSMLVPGQASRTAMLERCAELVEEAGGRAAAGQLAARHLEQALTILDHACPDGPDRRALAALAHQAARRST